MKSIVQMMIPEDATEILCKILIGYGLTVPTKKDVYEQLGAIVVFLEEALPPHPGAMSAYLKILNRFPADVRRKIPEGIQDFIEMNVEEIEKYYEGEIPSKYRKKAIQVSGLLDSQGNEISREVDVAQMKPDNFEVGQKFEGSIEDACNNPPTLKLV